MITWNCFLTFALPSAILSIIAALFAWQTKQRSKAIICSTAAITVLGFFIIGLWISLQRPPLRTMGETRLWYSFFTLVAGLFTYIKWQFRWILTFSSLLSIVFMVVNLLRPEIHDKSLMPVLQSIWFVPHVTVYMFSYSLLGVSAILALYGLFKRNKSNLAIIDSVVYAGLSFFTIGMLMGAVWAKDAWGAYWSWDPKETWALITWMIYLLYIHLRQFGQTKPKLLYILLLLSFISLQMCWYGINYIPSAKESVHIYNIE